MSVFGFTIKPPGSGGEFLPHIRYDARAGRIFRMDRALGDGGFVTDKIDITANFKALADFENIEAGWIDMQPGQAPSMVLVRRAPDMVFPPCPSSNHKQGIRFLIKLSGECADGQPRVREVSANSGAFLSGAEAVVAKYDAEKAAHPGQLPVIMLDGLPMPVETGFGQRKSTNYHPRFKIAGWAPRPADFVWKPREVSVSQAATTSTASTASTAANVSTGNGVAPATGGQRAAPPNLAVAATRQNIPDDFSSDFG